MSVRTYAYIPNQEVHHGDSQNAEQEECLKKKVIVDFSTNRPFLTQLV
jgi:hypothetical protein